MKILVATVYSSRGGGLSSHVADLIRCLKQRGHDVCRVDYDNIRLGPIQKICGIMKSFGRREHIRKAFVEGRLKNLSRVIDEVCAAEKFDIIHCHDPVAGFAARIGVHASKIPLVQTIHGPLVFESQMGTIEDLDKSVHLRNLARIERASFHQADRLIAVDTGQAGIARNKFGADPAKIDIIYNAVFCDEAERIAADEPTNAITGPYVLVPRRLVAKNGVDVAIRAIGELKDKLDIKLVSAGFGPLRQKFQALAYELGIEERVIFLGMQPRDEVLRLGKRAMAVLIPSKPDSGVVEATSIAAIEAMACGAAVIVSAIGGLAELVQSEYNGLTVPPNDPKALAEAILRVATDEGLHRKLVLAGHEHAFTQLDVSVWCDKILCVYDKAKLNHLKRL